MFKNIFALLSFLGSLFVLIALVITKRQSTQSVKLTPIRLRSR
jgi:hypothetical protein